MDRSLHVTVMYVLSHLGLIFFLYPTNIIVSSEQGHWLPILIGVIIHFVFLSMYMKGLSYFPKEDVVSIYSKIGKGTTFLFLLPLILYFMMILLVTVRAYAEIITIVFLANTPLSAIILLILSISTYIALNGIETILRTGFLLAILLLPIIVMIFFTSFQNVDWHYLVPFDPDLKFLRNISYYESFFAFTGGFLFLGFVQPYFTYTRKRIFIAATLLIPVFLCSVYIPILTFGQATASTTFLPFVVVVDTINISWLMFDRVTMFFLLSLIAFVMLYLSLIIWKTQRILNHFIPSIKSSFWMILLPLLAYLFSFFIIDWADLNAFFKWNTILRFYVLVTVPLSIYYFGRQNRRKEKHEIG